MRASERPSVNPDIEVSARTSQQHDQPAFTDDHHGHLMIVEKQQTSWKESQVIRGLVQQ